MNEKWYRQRLDSFDPEVTTWYFRHVKELQNYNVWLIWENNRVAFTCTHNTIEYRLFNRVARVNVPEDIRKAVSEYIENPFFEIDLRKYIIKEQLE